jgi:hypothetical protein
MDEVIIKEQRIEEAGNVRIISQKVYIYKPISKPVEPCCIFTISRSIKEAGGRLGYLAS